MVKFLEALDIIKKRVDLSVKRQLSFDAIIGDYSITIEKFSVSPFLELVESTDRKWYPR